MLLHCYLQPRASRDEIVGIHDDRLKIRITAPPVDGKANQHLIKIISKWFDVAKSQIAIVRGETGRQKTLAISNPSQLPERAAIKK